MEDRYLSRSELAKFLGVSERTIDRRAADGLLPPPVLIGPPKSKRGRRWRQSVVIAMPEKKRR